MITTIPFKIGLEESEVVLSKESFRELKIALGEHFDYKFPPDLEQFMRILHRFDIDSEAEKEEFKRFRQELAQRRLES